MKKIKLPLLLLISNLTFADYTAKIILQSDSAINNIGSLPSGSISFSNENGNVDPSLLDPDHIVCNFAGGGIGVPYKGYTYHHVQYYVWEGVEYNTVWFQDNYINAGLGTNFTRGAHMGENYYEICAPNRMHDQFNLKDETENGSTGLMLSLDGVNFENLLTINYDLSDNGSSFTTYFAVTENSSNNIIIENFNYSWISGSYGNSCIHMSAPYQIKKGQVQKSSSPLNLASCGINTPATLRLNYIASTGENASIILNITP